MRHHDLAIHGFGVIPGLLAIHMLGRSPGQSLLLLSGDGAIGGEALEPVLASSLSPAAQRLIEPFVVANWPGYLVTRGSAPQHRADPVHLIDPVQVWLELQSLLAPADLVARAANVRRDGETLGWDGGQVRAAEFVDLAAITRSDESSEIVGLEIARSLPLPVLADFDTGAEPWDAFQHIPLGDERVYVRKRRCHGDVEAALTSGFGNLLSELIAY